MSKRYLITDDIGYVINSSIVFEYRRQCCTTFEKDFYVSFTAILVILIRKLYFKFRYFV